MIKVCVVLVLLLFGSFLPVSAQGPIGTPLAPAPGSGGQGQPLPPMPLPIGQPLLKAPEQYLPTWQAPLPPPPPQPTPVNFDWYDVITLQSVPVYMAPNPISYVLTRLPSGTVVTVRWAGLDWLQLESGFAAGSYIQNNDLIRRV